MQVSNIPKLHTIGRGACGTVWANETGPAYKREDGNPSRSLQNDFEMHRRVIQSNQTLGNLKEKSKSSHPQIQIQIPACHNFIKASDKEWWFGNLQRFPSGYTPCNMIQSQRIPPFEEPTRQILIQKFCPNEIKPKIIGSQPDRDCLARLYLGRRRTHTRESETSSRFKAFSLRNYPLHEDQMEKLAISANDMHQYAKTMAEALAMMHWIAGIDGNDVEFVLASRNGAGDGMSNILGTHTMWMLDFDLCRDITMNENGIQQAVSAFWGNDPYYPRPGKALWNAFKAQYIQTSDECLELYDAQEKNNRRSLARFFIEQVEAWGSKVNSTNSTATT